jgi:hypothetical protein
MLYRPIYRIGYWRCSRILNSGNGSMNGYGRLCLVQ